MLGTDSFTLNIPNFYRNNIGYRIEYVYDNVVNKGLNLFNGTRYKIYVEQFKEVGNASENMVNLGFDFRHYQKIHRQIIFAGRVAGSCSVAKQKVMYYLGGVDSWIIPRFNNEIQIDRNRTYKYQALATNMRGFTQNIRNGNNFLVINTEVRVPVFAYLLNRPIKSDFVKNFQLMPFLFLDSVVVPVDLHFWSQILVISLVFTIIPLFLSLYGLIGLPSATMGILIYLNPIVAFIVAFLYFDESINLQKALAYGILLVSVVLFNWKFIVSKKITRS